MKSALTIPDVLQLSEIISQSVEFEMNIKTYLKIMGFGNSIENQIPQIQNKINGVKVNFNNSLEPDFIKFHSKLNSFKKKSIEIIIK